MNFNQKLAAAVSSAVLLMAGQVALADSTTDIVDALVSKGVLTEEEGKLIAKGHTSQKDKTPKVTEKDGSFKVESANGKNSIQLTGRLHFDYRNNSIEDMSTEATRGGQANDSDTASTADQFQVRRARVGIKGRVGGVADYLLQGNITGTTLLDEAYLDVNKFEKFSLKFGKFKQSAGLEQLTSSNNVDFIERSYVDQLVPNKKLGVQLHGEVPGFTYAGSVYQKNDTMLDSGQDDLSYAGRLTTNFSELMGNKDTVMHVGVSGFTEDYSVALATSGNTSSSPDGKERGTILSFRSAGAGLSNIFRAQIGGELMQMTDTSTCSVSGAGGTAAGGATCSAVTTINATYHTSNSTTAKVKNDAIGLEGIFGYGPFKAQGEFIHMDTKGSYTSTTPGNNSGINLKTDAYYLEAMYMITGEKYADAYKKGAFGLVKPKNDFDLDKGTGLGAWEVGFRYDGFHVYDGSIASGSSYSRFQGTLNNVSDTVKVNTAETAVALAGGIQSRVDSYTGGLKWILNPNMVLKGTYTYSKFNNPMQPIDIGAGSPASGNKVYDHESLLLIRGQYMF